MTRRRSSRRRLPGTCGIRYFDTAPLSCLGVAEPLAWHAPAAEARATRMLCPPRSAAWSVRGPTALSSGRVRLLERRNQAVAGGQSGAARPPIGSTSSSCTTPTTTGSRRSRRATRRSSECAPRGFGMVIRRRDEPGRDAAAVRARRPRWMSSSWPAATRCSIRQLGPTCSMWCRARDRRDRRRRVQQRHPGEPGRQGHVRLRACGTGVDRASHT